MAVLTMSLYTVGVLSKSTGQIIRISAVMHILFRSEEGLLPLDAGDGDKGIVSDAIKAAIHFIEVSCQHVAYIAGRTNIKKGMNGKYGPRILSCVLRGYWLV